MLKPLPPPDIIRPCMFLKSVQHEYNPPHFPLALATATKASGDGGHVLLELSLCHPSDHEAVSVHDAPLCVHACLLVQTDDVMWASLETLAPAQLSNMWDRSSRDQLFTYLVDSQVQPPPHLPLP